MTMGVYDIWTYDLMEGFLERITFDPSFDGAPIWADQDRRIVFNSARSGAFNLWWKSADGLGEAEELLPSGPEDGARYPESWSPDGVLAYRERHESNGWDLWLLPVEGDRVPQPFRTTEFNELRARFSPDGTILAYDTRESGVWEVYIEPVPQTGKRIKVSRGGGIGPTWSEDGTQLYFYVPGTSLWTLVSQISTEPELEASTPVRFYEKPEGIHEYWPFETSRGFLGIERDPAPQIRQYEIVLNFFEELRRRDTRER
jgi:Tol biopolymer transport system component